ncbi:MAG: hypothetical protein EZS28_029276 [Streblomastix strix]|uniref:SPRY domain-containing protein n=1 Tax=Streblomastix strix TaxID=222440 RepID=A0A5J4UY85_9EUKA|nr:MAG: hypothetical protein EZS28_029276 [Streblomastix strix]
MNTTNIINHPLHHKIAISNISLYLNHQLRNITNFKQNDVLPALFKIGNGAKVSFPSNCVVKLDNFVNTIVVFDKEINSGIWKFTTKGKSLKFQYGVGIIDSTQVDIPHPYDYQGSKNNNTICSIASVPYIKGFPKYGSGSKGIKTDDISSVIVDMTSNPRTFCILINNELEPFCVTSIPERVKFVFLFSNKDSEWEFISLEQINMKIDLSKIEERKKYKYEQTAII